MMRFPSNLNGRSVSDVSSEFASCDSMYSEDSDDDDCQVVGVRPPPRTAAAAAAGSPAASQKSRNSSWSAWGVRPAGKRPGGQGREVKRENGSAGPELVDDNQQRLRREWEAATLRRRTCPPMRSEGSKAGTNGHWASRAPQSGSVHRETDSSANLGGESGTVETVQSNGHVSPAQDISLHALSESTSTSAADSVVGVPEVERRESSDAEPDEVASREPPGSDDQVLPDSSSSSVFRSREDPPLDMESPPPRFARESDVKKGSKRRYEAEDAAVAQMKLRTNRMDGASISGHGGINSLKHMDIGNGACRRTGGGIHWGVPADNGHRSSGHAGGLDPAFEQDLVGAKEKLKETVDFKLADQEEWARRQEELQKQSQEVRRLRERKKAETDRKNEVELRQKLRLEEIRQTQRKEERNMDLKDQIRGKVQADLERLASGCRDMATLLRLLHIPVEGGVCPSVQQVNAAYKKALLRFHPDRTSARDPKRQVEAEETFKLITRMKPILKPSSFFTAMTAR